MRRILSLLGLFTILLSGTSQAAGVNLRWNACYGDGGSANRTSACTSNLGSAGTMVGSFELDNDITGVTGVEITAQVVSAGSTLPAWWTFNAPGGTSGCRGSALAVNPTISGAAVNCVDWAVGKAAGGLASYRVGYYGANTARIQVGFATAAPMDLVRNTELFAMNMNVSNSSVSKGETLIDTAMTLNAMRPDILVVRHHAAGAVELLAQKVDCSVINAGDGAHQHPTQALLDALTIRRAKGRVGGLTVAICGDILHSRVARSNIHALTKLGADVTIVGATGADGNLYNGRFVISVVNATQFTYTMKGTPTASAAGARTTWPSGCSSKVSPPIAWM